jgi:hypothetical protein
MSKAMETEGMVVGLDFVRSVKMNSRTGSYNPVVKYSYNGIVTVFRSNVGSSPSNYRVGDKVQVCFDPNNLKDAQINDWSNQWLAVTILGGIGSFFFLIGGSVGYVAWKRRKMIETLLASGTRIEADFDSVKMNTLVSVNRRNPYQIHCHWVDKSTSTTYNFRSDNLWSDPTPRIKTKLTVYVDSADYKKYYMDLSFLD